MTEWMPSQPTRIAARCVGSASPETLARKCAVAASQGQLRPAISCGAPQRLAVNELAEAIEENRLTGLDGDALELRRQAKTKELPGPVRQDIDAHAERPELGGRLEHPRRNAGLLERQRQRQAANAAADDDHIRSHDSMLMAQRADHEHPITGGITRGPGRGRPGTAVTDRARSEVETEMIAPEEVVAEL